MANLSILPTEILRYIYNYIPESKDRHRAAHSMALVYKSLNATAVEQMYRRAWVDRKNCWRFLRTAITVPELAAQIRSIQVEVADMGSDPVQDLFFPYMHSSLRSSRRNRHLAPSLEASSYYSNSTFSVLWYTPNIRKLRLCMTSEHLPLHYQALLQTLPELRIVLVERADFFELVPFMMCPWIRVLDFGFRRAPWTLASHRLSEIRLRQLSSRLQILRIRNIDLRDFFEPDCEKVMRSCGQLTELMISGLLVEYIDSSDRTSLVNILDALSPLIWTLKKLIIARGTEFWMFTAIEDIQHLKCLEWLEIPDSGLFGIEFNPDILGQLPRTIKTLALSYVTEYNLTKFMDGYDGKVSPLLKFVNDRSTGIPTADVLNSIYLICSWEFCPEKAILNPYPRAQVPELSTLDQIDMCFYTFNLDLHDKAIHCGIEIVIGKDEHL